jgi:PKD repeat protein/streptogramin lyase
MLTVGIHGQTAPDDFQHITSTSEELHAPSRIAADVAGFTYVTDAFNHSISRYDASGNFLETINAVEQPVSVAVNKEGILFIGDGATGFIYQYDQTSGTKEFYSGSRYPSSMEFGPDNTLYVTDSKLQRVLVLDLSGNLIRTIGEGTLDYPTGIALDNQNKRIIVGEHGGAGTGFNPKVRVYMFDLQGNLFNSFGSHGNGDGQFYRVQGLTIGRCGNIYVADPYLARISVFDENGSYITKFGEFGLLEGELNVPMDIVFDSQERCIVASMNNGALEVFSISDDLPSSNIKNESGMICEGESMDIEVAFTGTAPWSFTYTIDGLNPTVVNTSDNPYTLTVSEGGHYEVIALSDATSSGTCFTGSADVVVTSTIPAAQMTGDAAICEGETAEISLNFTGSAPWNFTYTHNGLNPISIATVNNPHTIDVTEAGVYELSSLEGGGCEGAGLTGSATILVNPLPTAIMADGTNDVIIDPGESANLPVELTGSPPWAINYTVNDRDPVSISDINEGLYSIISSKTGVYEVKEVSDANCTSYSSLGFPQVILNTEVELPTSHMDGGDFDICPGESVPISIQFTGVAPWTFSYAVDTLMTTTIFNTYTNPYIINAIHAGNYEVIALSDSKYSGTDFTGNAFVSFNPVAAPGFDYTPDYLDVSFINTPADADSYLWDFGDGNTSIEMNPDHQYQEAGEYIVSLTGSNGLCGDITFADTISVQAVSAHSIGFDDLLSVYPNPSTGMFTIEISNNQQLDLDIEIINMLGQVVHSINCEDQYFKQQVDLSGNSAGFYILSIRSGMHLKTVKLILK